MTDIPMVSQGQGPPIIRRAGHLVIQVNKKPLKEIPGNYSQPFDTNVVYRSGIRQALMQSHQDTPAQGNKEPIYQGGLLEVIINRTGIRGVFSRTVRASCDRFSRRRLFFHSAHRFKPGAKVVVDLCIGSVLASELVATITGAERLADRWCYQADFCFEHKHMTSPAISRALLFIEQKLRIQSSYPIG